jgi:KDO2-lipid IV(A) lauroyltransferase
VGRRPLTDQAERLLRNADWLAYWLVVAPLAARLPARAAYRIACWRGDLGFRYRVAKRTEIVANLREVFGDQISPEEAQREAREYFRLISCEVIDTMLLRDQTRPLAKLVEIRGREHLDAALAEGKGAIICNAHFGSYNSAFSLLHENGFPLTTIGRSVSAMLPDTSSLQRWVWNSVYIKRMRRHRQRPGIELQSSGIQAAVQAAVALRANEVVTISSDAAPLEADLSRAAEVTLLGRPALLLPGVVTLAKLTSAPVFMMFMHRSADYRHQVLEISPQVSMDGDPATVFGRYVTALDTAIRAKPAHWVYWANTHDLVRSRLVPARSGEQAAIVPQPASVSDR